jgi:hypothetical protein
MLSIESVYVCKHAQAKKSLGSKTLVFGVICFLQICFKCAFVNQPGLTQLHASQPTISEEATQILYIVATVGRSRFDGNAIIEYSWVC